MEEHDSNSFPISKSDVGLDHKETEVFIFDEPDPLDHT
jgi:hypothetical protein